MIELVKEKRERAIAVGLATRLVRRKQAEEHLEELELLADTAGANVIAKILQEKDRMDSALYIGKGKVAELKQLVDDEKVSLVLFDDDLSPVQVRNLERELECKVLDRSGLILDIFATRAKSNEAKTQVELAQLQYLLPRLTRQWTHLSKQFGGIGTKGPGETQIETDRRMIRQRIAHLKEKLAKISSQRKTQRQGRKEFHTLALVGYTNVGKSTLLNTLSDSNVFVENRLFATLDATTRLVALSPTTRVLVTDTVGFIRKLPHHLVASFKSTLEEVIEADVLLHVVDVSNPHFEEHIEVVRNTLSDLGTGDKPVVYVFNKIDSLEDRSFIREIQDSYAPAIFISAQRGINILGLQEHLLSMIHSTLYDIEITIPHTEYKLLSRLYELAEILEKKYEDDMINITARISEKNKSTVDALLATLK